jgi:hypothetical protein
MVANDVRLVTFVEVLIPQLTVWDFVTDDEVGSVPFVRDRVFAYP